MIPDLVAMEEPLVIELNGKTVAVMMRLPGDEKELAAGFCVSEGLVPHFQDITLIHHCGQSSPMVDSEDGLEESRNLIQISAKRVNEALLREDKVMMIRSGCGRADVRGLDELLPRCESDSKVSLETIFSLVRKLQGVQIVYQMTRGSHIAALFDLSGELVVSKEDIGRHNAIDKVIGHCLFRGIELSDKLLFSSGRISYEMVVKAIRSRISVVLSFCAPTSVALELAEASGCTVIGFLRGSRAKVYTNQWRVSAGRVTIVSGE
ncbi:FdhD protein [Candidatus Hakubella thermalkaliphila]|uniref:Sulfur carrier protein FdhD n=2 Tax=Candidatus Hakubella thermalkaliphila TaxID=2754717 RepID=A0A6V8QFH2_9ACTN|nr:FdhD protein [Candidatus Hakubella thermalkaliphila]GFP43485.1 FdhD protein [Candidatus Hakubella thermalkaliphila]